MDQKQLLEQLDELNEAIEDLHAPEEDKAKLAELIADIEQQVEGPLIAAEQQPLADQVDHMITRFEAEHPGVAGILNNIMLTLSSMGV